MQLRAPQFLRARMGFIRSAAVSCGIVFTLLGHQAFAQGNAQDLTCSADDTTTLGPYIRGPEDGADGGACLKGCTSERVQVRQNPRTISNAW